MVVFHSYVTVYQSIKHMNRIQFDHLHPCAGWVYARVLQRKNLRLISEEKTHNPSGGIKMFATSLCLLLELEHILFFGPRWWRKNSISLSAVEVLRFQSEHQNIHCLLRFQHWSSSWSLIISQVQGWTFCAAFFFLGLCEKFPHLTHPRFWSWISQVLIFQELHQKFKIQRNHIWMIPPSAIPVSWWIPK